VIGGPGFDYLVKSDRGISGVGVHSLPARRSTLRGWCEYRQASSLVGFLMGGVLNGFTFTFECWAGSGS